MEFGEFSWLKYLNYEEWRKFKGNYLLTADTNNVKPFYFAFFLLPIM